MSLGLSAVGEKCRREFWAVVGDRPVKIFDFSVYASPNARRVCDGCI